MEKFISIQRVNCEEFLNVFFSLLLGEDKETWLQNQGADHSTDLRQPAVRFTVQDI